MAIEALYTRVIAPAMWRIGCLWAEGAITVADEHLATALTHRVMASAYGSSFGRATTRPGRVLLAVVEGQRHALGLRMAADVLELGGYEVNYLGEDVPLDALIGAIESRQPDLVGLSSTLPPETSSLAATVAEVERTFPDLPILLGGQGVPSEGGREGHVMRTTGLEGLVTLVEGALLGVKDVSTLATSRPPDLLFHSESDSAEGRMLGAAADAADLARIHARMAHSYRRLAYEDAVIKGPNRRAFDDRLALLADSPQAAPVAILILDLDAFKQVNDTSGHDAGDRALRAVFKAIDSCLREGDLAARLGGDEFASLLPNTGIAEAEQVAARVLDAIRETGSKGLTATIGVAALGEGPRRAMLAADLALYRAKAGGGDSIGVAGEEDR